MRCIKLANSNFNPIEYKKRTIRIWNEVAPRYHKRWASIDSGPFQSTTKLVKLAKIKKGDIILDLACGTGVVTNKISSKVGKKGMVIGIDTSKKAISIAKKFNAKKNNIEFVLSDAENFYFNRCFDVITCQYALFLFPNSQKALHTAKKLLKENGTIAISVHGKNVPFFDNILDAILKFIPDYIPLGAPSLDRFGTKKSLSDEVKKAGFSKIKVNEFTFRYSPGTFTDYWSNYKKYIAKPLKEKLDKLSTKQKKVLRETVKKNAIPYTKKDGTIVFPWQVLILTAKK